MTSAAPLRTPIYQVVNKVKRKILPETSVNGVYTGDGSLIIDKINDISENLTSKTNSYVVSDIDELTSLTDVKAGDSALVKDATGDPTVDKGFAVYVLEAINKEDTSKLEWVKWSEEESLDIVIKWSNITGTPGSTVKSIDTLAGVLGSMGNNELTVGDVNKKLLLNGEIIGSTHRGYVDVDPSSKDFNSAVTALDLPDGAMFTIATNKTMGNIVSAGFINVGPDDPNFEEEIEKMNLQDGAFFSSIEGAPKMEPDTTHIRSTGYLVNIDEDDEDAFLNAVEEANFKNGAFFTVLDGDITPMDEDVSEDERFVGYLYDLEPGTPEFLEAVSQLGLANGAMFGVISSE